MHLLSLFLRISFLYQKSISSFSESLVILITGGLPLSEDSRNLEIFDPVEKSSSLVDCEIEPFPIGIFGGVSTTAFAAGDYRSFFFRVSLIHEICTNERTSTSVLIITRLRINPRLRGCLFQNQIKNIALSFFSLVILLMGSVCISF